MNRIIAIACSTGGPKALQKLIPSLNSNLNCPVLIVQHMPDGFTKTLAERLDSLTDIKVSEAEDGEIIEDNHIYIAKAGFHLKVAFKNGHHRIVLEDGELREGVKPCANYMYESLSDSRYDEIICIVLTGMGSDGTEGIINLNKKKKIKVIVQDKDTSVVHGMPGSILKTDLVCTESHIEEIGKEIKKLMEE
ncbi:MAG: chemotaxis protein CheB [Lachnospiraceae bacterium]|nr:chemotaxis protein CheB [Lachnospiraceae bacterium]